MASPREIEAIGSADLPLSLKIGLKVLTALGEGSLRIELPDERSFEFKGAEPGPDAFIRIHRIGLFRNLLIKGGVGFAEAYMDGDWDTPDLADALELLARNEQYLNRRYYAPSRLRKWMHDGLHWLRRNSRRGSRRNIEYHYDLGNDFYRLWLDETLTYSSAIFEHPGQPLAAAQHHKYDSIIRRLALGRDHHLLEIGCGWGGFAIHAAQKTGCRVTGITLSKEQLAEARRRADQAGVADRVHFVLQDYRDVREQFDRIASIEMYEAVGERFWPDYFGAIQASLVPGGRAVLHGITIADDKFEEYKSRVDFIQRYIFPGGMLASPEAFLTQARKAGLTADAPDYFGEHYARTLAQWHQRLLAVEAEIKAKFDQRFLRMWRYYLAYCEAGFRSGRIDLMQVSLIRPEG